MSRIRLATFTILALGFLVAAPARGDDGDRARLMPANRDKIAQALLERGVIPRNATPQQLDAAVTAYLQSKKGAEKPGNKLARKLVDANEAALDAAAAGSAIRGRKLGQSTSVDASSPQFKGLAGEGKLLLIAVEFDDKPYTWTTAAGDTRTRAGPLHNSIARPDNTYDLWRTDFDIQHYERMLFSDGGWTIPEGRYAGEKRMSMRDYYLAQSFGNYTISGKAYGWYKVSKPEAYYGDDDADGNDLLPGTTWDLIRDAVAVINAPGNPQPIPWAEYDTNGDCVLDHVLFIHAGVDDSAGGGAQGTDAIWAHSWDVSPPAAVTGPTAACPGGLVISNYTIMPEDGGIGVFAHEFGHDLGLPDEYDTAYTGNGESIEYWSIMSSGSWSGAPAQTEPTSMSPWARMVLGWLTGDQLANVNLSDLGKTPQGFRLEQSSFWGGANTLNALRVNLPPTHFTYTSPHSGARAFWGGRSDLRDARLTRAVDLTGKSSASLAFWTWYDIEEGWDFAFVQVSQDGGTSWTSLSFDGTTSSHDPAAHPAIVAALPGLTGYSGGWVQKTVDLSAYAGKQILVRFRYMTDWGTTYGGLFVDDVAISANGAPIFSDDVETDAPGWDLGGSGGFSRSDGTQDFARYYMLEWRNTRNFSVARGGTSIVNPDFGLQRTPQYDPYGSTGNANEPWIYSYNTGLVLWLRDTLYTENWTRAHIGHGYLLVVDAHDQPINRPSAGSTRPGYGTYPFLTRVQISDASFSLDRALDFTLGYWGVTKSYSGLNAVPTFDDSLTYWNVKTPDASTYVPSFGFTFRVVGQANDGSAALVGLGRK